MTPYLEATYTCGCVEAFSSPSPPIPRIDPTSGGTFHLCPTAAHHLTNPQRVVRLEWVDPETKPILPDEPLLIAVGFRVENYTQGSSLINEIDDLLHRRGVDLETSRTTQADDF